MTKFSSMFVILTLDHVIIDKLNKVHNKKIEKQDIAIKFEV